MSILSFMPAAFTGGIGNFETAGRAERLAMVGDRSTVGLRGCWRVFFVVAWRG